MPKAKAHIHKIIKVNGKHTSIWKCGDPNCNYFVYPAQELILIGRASICWGCSNKFALSEESMKDEMPLCEACRSPEFVKLAGKTEPRDIFDAFIDSKDELS